MKIWIKDAKARLSLLIIAVASISTATYYSLSQRVPEEIEILQNIINQIGQANNLGNSPLAFMVSSGSQAAYLAEQQGLCKPNECDSFAYLNPYKQHSSQWDELIRQSYALGEIQGWATASGTVVIPRSTFRIYGPRHDFLACTIAHEIAHIKRNHAFNRSYQENHRYKSLAKKQMNIAVMRLARQQELEADRDAAAMLSRAGFRNRVCQDELVYMHKANGDGSSTQPESAHPGFDERVKAIRSYYNVLDKKPLKPLGSTPGAFSYKRSENLLIFTPQSIQIKVQGSKSGRA